MNNLDNIPESTQVLTPQARFEQERMTRRAALRKIGLTAGLTVVAAVSIDDIARLAAAQIRNNKSTKDIGDMLTKEFANSGIARADVPNCQDMVDDWYATCVGDLSVPWGCSSGGGSIFPWCVGYNLALIDCRHTQTELTQRCAENDG